MTGELRILGIAHGLLLGFLLGAPALAPSLLPWATATLFLVGGFQLRLADRRAGLRGRASWISHIRMAPQRLIPWAAAAIGALGAGEAYRAGAILTAAFACELLLYPLCAPAMARLSRRRVTALLGVLTIAAALIPFTAVAFAVAFLAGVATCLSWMRGPDGEVTAFALCAGAAATMPLLVVMIPSTAPLVVAPGTVCAVLALAHLSVVRRRPVPWHRAGGTELQVRRPRWPRPQQQS